LNTNKKHSLSIINNFGYLVCLFITPNIFINCQTLAQESYKLNEIEINRTNDIEDEDNLDFLTNPFELVDRIRRSNSMNDATKPSDAINEAIKSFDMIKE
tara:strand:- start:241 stop:540 length:300 start_codon:yes stop_codon:yes gene_type:complete